MIMVCSVFIKSSAYYTVFINKTTSKVDSEVTFKREAYNNQTLCCFLYILINNLATINCIPTFFVTKKIPHKLESYQHDPSLQGKK